MDYRKLGRTDLKVSEIALGTMTWGEQNTQAEAFEQIEYAKNAGINFIDTAEMYPVPPKAETYASTERYIGNWFKERGDRTDWVLASKIAGPGNGIDYIRDGNLKHNRTHIVQALDASLKRLQTDMGTLYGLDYFEQVQYRVVKKGQDNTLVISARGKRSGTDYLRLGLSLSDDMRGGSAYNLGASYRMNGINRLGAEWLTTRSFRRHPAPPTPSCRCSRLSMTSSAVISPWLMP